LHQFDPAHRPIVLEDLLDLDLNVNPCWTPTHAPDEAEYRRRFPDYPDAVARAFRELNATPAGSQDDRASSDARQQGALAASSEPLPSLPGHLVIERQLGSGGFGTVYLAEDTKLRRHVAVKVLRQDLFDDPIRRDMHLREARIAAGLRHDNLVTIHQLLDGQCLGFVMEYLEGGTLRDLRKSWPSGSVNIDEILEVMEKVAQAVHFIHTAGLVHRDLKPANILLDGAKQPHIVDLGLAALISNLAGGQEPAGGSLPYMSPEQVRHYQGQPAQIDSRSDIWSLGVILYEMLTGRLPFQGSPAHVMDAIERTEIISPKQFTPETTWLSEKGSTPLILLRKSLFFRSGSRDLTRSLPPRSTPQLDAIVHRCLSKNPDERFQTAHKLAEALLACCKARIIATREICQQYGYSLKKKLPPNVVVREGIEAAQFELAGELILQFHLGKEFPPKGLILRMIERAQFVPALVWMQRFHLEERSLIESAIRGLLGTESYKDASHWIQEMHFTDSPVVEDTIRQLVKAGGWKLKTAARWAKKFGLTHKFPPETLVHKMIEAGQLGDAAEVVRMFDLTDKFSPEDLVRRMFETDQWRAAGAAIDQFAVAEKFSVEDIMNIVVGMIHADRLRDAFRFATKHGVVHKFPPGSFRRSKL
jgi:serine/threonine protein kinase